MYGDIPLILQGAATRETLTPEQTARLQTQGIPTTSATGTPSRINAAGMLPFLVVGAVAAWFLTRGSRSRTLWIMLLLLIPSWLFGQTTVDTTRSTSAWVETHGDSTVYGHTDRIIITTTVKTVDSVVVKLKRSLAIGLFDSRDVIYCQGQTTAAGQTISPVYLLGRLQKASACGFRFVLVPPRSMLTTNGQIRGIFSVDSAKKVTDRYAKILVPDTLKKYKATLIGFNLADDYDCPTCWGGQKITQQQINQWAVYTRTKIPGLYLGVRIEPKWVAVYPVLATSLDYAWAQYSTNKGSQQSYYRNADSVSKLLRFSMVYGVNVEDCSGVGTLPCTATQLKTFGTYAVNFPGNCAFLSWRYDSTTWNKPDIHAVWNDLILAASAKPSKECRHASTP